MANKFFFSLANFHRIHAVNIPPIRIAHHQATASFAFLFHSVFAELHLNKNFTSSESLCSLRSKGGGEKKLHQQPQKKKGGRKPRCIALCEVCLSGDAISRWSAHARGLDILAPDEKVEEKVSRQKTNVGCCRTVLGKPTSRLLSLLVLVATRLFAIELRRCRRMSTKFWH